MIPPRPDGLFYKLAKAFCSTYVIPPLPIASVKLSKPLLPFTMIGCCRFLVLSTGIFCMMLGRLGLKPMGTLTGLESECFVGEPLGYLRRVVGSFGDLGSLSSEFFVVLDIFVSLPVPPYVSGMMRDPLSIIGLNLAIEWTFSLEGEARNCFSSWPKLLCVCRRTFWVWLGN